MQPLDTNRVPLAGTNLIEASAGTGKTYAIATLYVRGLLETQARVENILVVTYTRAATAELRDRIRRRIAETRTALLTKKTSDASLQELVDLRAQNGDIENDCKRLSLALRSFDQASIFTIHGFCQRSLQEAAFESGTAFESTFEADDRALASDIADDFWASEMFDVDASLFAYFRSCKLGPDELRTLALRVIGNPDLVVLPEQSAAAGSGAADTLASFERRYNEARDRWHASREEILTLLANSAQLKQTSYKPDQIVGKYGPAIDQLFTLQRATLVDASHALHRFSLEALAAGKGTKKGKEPPVHDFFEKASEFLADCALVQEHFDAQLMALKLRLVSYVREQNALRKQEQATLSFDDLLLQLRASLRRDAHGEEFANAIATRYPLALIDEFQDTDPVQYEIFRRIYHRDGESHPHRALFLIGDPKQAIYGFRGADLFTYFRARTDAADRCHTLATNYRSSPGMVAATNRVFEGPRDSFLFSELAFSSVGHRPGATDLLVDADTDSSALELLILDRKRDDGSDGTPRVKSGEPRPMNKGSATATCADRTAGEIVRLLRSDATIDARRVEPGDIAVLVRTNRQARSVQDALGALGVPSVLESDESVFTTFEALQLHRVLYAMVYPGDRSAIRAALATDILGLSGNDLARLQDDEEAWEEELFAFRRWHETWTSRGFFQAFSQMMHEKAVSSRLLARLDGERKMTNLGQLAELLQERALQTSAGPQVLCAWLETMRIDQEARSAAGDAAQLRLETDAAAVKVVTVHKSKGLEYGIVFCPFLWQGQSSKSANAKAVRFHDEEDDSRLKLDIGSDDLELHRQQASRETLAEDLRLLYVALTRSRYRCSVVCGVLTSFGTSALAYVLLRDDALETDFDALQAFAKGVEKLEDEELLEALQKHATEGTTVRSLQPYSGLPYEGLSHAGSTLESRTTSRSLSSAWRTSSFSGLTRNSDADHDHDAGSADAPADSAGGDEGKPVTMATVPAGAHPGQMLHHVFEHLDFAQAGEDNAPSPELETIVSESLQSFGFDAGRWGPTLVKAYEEILRTPLSAHPEGKAFALADLPRAQRLDELEFNFPIRPGASRFQASMLAESLAHRASPPWGDSYLGMVQALGFRPLSGFLKGFMDLVFVYEGRWYLMDYKSNRLGTHYGDYSAAAMSQVMAKHHYYLQYHIYLVALDRYLRLRLADYDYERDFGGVYYLFMRGMHPDAPPGSGVFFDRPSAAEIESLHEAFGQESR